MTVYQGKGVYGAAAVGTAAVFRRQTAQVSRRAADDTQKELERFDAARELARAQLREIYEKALREAGEADAEIFEIHSMMLDDDDFISSVRSIIGTEMVNAEYAVFETSERFSAMFAQMDSEYMQARSSDIKDVSDRLIACMNGGVGESFSTDGRVIVCADDLAPSETVLLDKDKVLAFVTAKGSLSSHTAILARTMNIPAVVGAGEEFIEALHDGDMMIADGHTGKIYLSPDEETVRRYEKIQAEDKERRERLLELRGQDNITLDGRRIDVFANIGGAADVDAVIGNDAGGIGLFRSEFLYLGRTDYPTEEQQLAAYRRVLEKMSGKRVVIRTLDIGADKRIGYFGLDEEENPALGLRAVRLCLTRPEIFRTQLRALYRASVFGDLCIMFPMITSVPEVERCIEMCRSVREELSAEGFDFDADTQLGIMIETPAAAIISDRLAPLVDFFSIGTNDLTQYTLACDRQNAKLGVFDDPHHEAVLRLIELTAKNARENGKWTGICGELAADLSMTETFLRMGIDELSVSPSFVLPLREKIRSIRLG